jgi:hypothetical protein
MISVIVTFTRSFGQWFCTAASDALRFLLKLDPATAKMELVRRGYSWNWNPLSKKLKPWQPGQYEGLSPEQVRAQVGTAVVQTVFSDTKTPRSMRGFNLKTAALRNDGKLCKPLNG